MKVFKFGGASVKDAEAVKNVGRVLKACGGEQLLVVVSAMGKTTNALEKLVQSYISRDGETAAHFESIRSFHAGIIRGLLSDSNSSAYNDIDNLFIELECLLELKPQANADLIYDQVVSYGEIISSRIISAYLNESGFRNRWMDARNFIITSNNYRDAAVLWKETEEVTAQVLAPILKKQMVVTQGFIGRSTDNSTTTLGREGSDYSAAIFAWCLQAESVTIWKDVAGVMTADPKRIINAEKIERLSYNEAIELAYYGATVIHPKTIQPLKNRHIPLYVKSFLDPEAAGTTVEETDKAHFEKPIYIFKPNQSLISISSRDFSFIAEENLGSIFLSFAQCRVKLNLMQHSAISFSVCIDTSEEKIKKLRDLLSVNFGFQVNAGCELITIRNYNEQALDSVLEGRSVLLEQKTRKTLQVVVR
jgi:aspartate kinase